LSKNSDVDIALAEVANVSIPLQKLSANLTNFRRNTKSSVYGASEM
jgi:hypothetical protein